MEREAIRKKQEKKAKLKTLQPQREHRKKAKRPTSPSPSPLPSDDKDNISDTICPACDTNRALDWVAYDSYSTWYHKQCTSAGQGEPGPSDCPLCPPKFNVYSIAHAIVYVDLVLMPCVNCKMAKKFSSKKRLLHFTMRLLLLVDLRI